MWNFRRIIHLFIQKATRDHVGTYSAQAAYFILLSSLPFAILLLTLLQYLPLSFDDLLGITRSLLPGAASAMIEDILQEVYERSTVALTSFTIIFVLWSAGRAIFTITGGINEIYSIRESRRYLHLRILAMIYTFLLAFALLLILMLLVFGRQIIAQTAQVFPRIHHIFVMIMSMRLLIMFVILNLFFIFVYMLLPNRKTKFTHVLPGSLVCSLGWIITSYIFAYLFHYTTNFSYMYGSLAGIMMIMLLLYWYMYQLFLGAEFNLFLYPEDSGLKPEQRRNIFR